MLRRGRLKQGLPRRGAGGERDHLPGLGAALCGLKYLQTGHGVPRVDRHRAPPAYRVGERRVEG
jgi:hypothetical protein